MKKRIALLAAMLALMLIAGSFAFAAEQQKADIEQHIYERNSKDRTLSLFKEVTVDQALFPAVGEAKFDGDRWFIFQNSDVSKPIYGKSLKNELDRFVFVENVGNVDVYVRTWFAFEEGTYGKSVLDDLIHLNFNDENWARSEVTSGVEIDGNKYTVFYADYKNADYKTVLEAGKTAEPSLMQLYMDSKGTNEDMIALDGNGSGKYEIGIYSQAVGTTSFSDAKTALDTAFGTAHPWTSGLNAE